ncbi:MAG TPA: 30S ribosomal protein S9 [Micromonosporaceae bacterium]|nr:30S ribosomal protein S9 [Micromonosporaceae bacterium]
MTETTEAETTAPEATAPEAAAPEAAAPGATDEVVVETVATTPTPAAPSSRPRSTARPTKGGHLAQTVGRRKEAIVRVRLVPGNGTFTLNGRTIESYFPNKVHQQLVREPLVITERTESFDIIANLRGGGTTGQAGALRLAVARAIAEVEPDDRPTLKKAGFLTRDARVAESKKYGLKKARKAPQYSKR